MTHSAEQVKRSVASTTPANGSSTNTPTQTKRRRGRPHKQILPQMSFVFSVSSPKPSVTNPKLSLGSVVECLKKLSDQNKNLLDLIEVLSEEVKKNAVTEISTGIENNEVPSRTTVEDVSDRLEKLEQNLNSNVLICRGTAVESPAV